MADYIELGKITAPVGIKGELRVFPYTDEQTRFSAVKKLLAGGREYAVESVRYQKDMVVLKLKGVDDRNAAEALRNQLLTISRDDIWDNPEDTYFVKDLVGMKVVSEDGKPIGTLSNVLENPAHDLYEISPEDTSKPAFLVPAVKEFILDVDLENRVMTIHLMEGLDSL
jgi:16S rRNA processing protein RimM